MAGQKLEVDVSGLAQEWDEASDIRQRLRASNLGLIHPQTGEKVLIKTAVLNASVLQPVLHRMANARGEAKACPSPAVEDLREQVSELYTLSKREIDFKTVDGPAWEIRKFISFLKMKIRKQDVSMESGLFRIQVFRKFGCSCILELTVWVCYLLNLLSRSLSQDHDFQQMVLILDPSLQDSCLICFGLCACDSVYRLVCETL